MTKFNPNNLQFNISQQSQQQIEKQKIVEVEKDVNLSYAKDPTSTRTSPAASSRDSRAAVPAVSPSVLASRVQETTIAPPNDIGNLMDLTQTSIQTTTQIATNFPTTAAPRSTLPALATSIGALPTSVAPRDTLPTLTTIPTVVAPRGIMPTAQPPPEPEIVVRHRFDMPQIFIKKITLDEQQGQQISKIKFGLKIAYDEANDRMLETYDDSLVINLIQIKDKNLYSFLNLSKELLWYVVNSDKLRTLPQIILNISRNIGLTKEGTVEEIVKIFKDSKFVNIETVTPKNIMAVARQEKDRYGNSAINLEYEKVFKSDMSGEHLSYFAYADLDKQNLQNRNMNDAMQVENIRVASEIVMNDKKMMPQTYGYYITQPLTKEKILWTDFKHFDGNQGQWYTGKVTDTEEHKTQLAREVFFNTKIRDETIFSKIEKNIGSLDTTSRGAPSALTTSRGAPSALTTSRGAPSALVAPISSLPISAVPRSPISISPIKMLGVDQQAVLVHVNTELLLEKYSPLYPHVSSLNLKNSNIIKNVRVFKKRVKIEEKSNYVKDFRINEPTVYLSNPIIEIDNISEINKIKIIDNDIKEGKYCYGLEIYFSDVIKQELEIYLDELKKAKSFLSRYYNDSKIRDLYYDDERDTFTEQFFLDNEKNTQITKSVEIFLESYAKVIPNSVLSSDIKSQILIHISPKTGTPGSILRFMKCLQLLMRYYEDVLKKSSTVSVYKEDRYFNTFEQVIEFSKGIEGIVQKPGTSLYGNFFDNNNLIIEKQQENSYVSIQTNNVWENMDRENKQFITDWTSLTNFILNKYESVSDEDKFQKAIVALNEISITQVRNAPRIYSRPRPGSTDRFNLLIKSGKQIIQEDLRNIYFSILSVPKEYTTTSNISDLKITEVMNTVVRSNR